MTELTSLLTSSPFLAAHALSGPSDCSDGHGVGLSTGVLAAISSRQPPKVVDQTWSADSRCLPGGIDDHALRLSFRVLITCHSEDS